MMSKALACLRSIADGLLHPRKQRRDVENEKAVDDFSTRAMAQVEAPFDLLGLPDSGLMNIISFLRPGDQFALFETSRACAKIVLNYHAEGEACTSCKVSKLNSWRGLRQVLSWIQTPLRLTFDSHELKNYAGISAYDVFLNTESLPSSMQQAVCNKCRFPSVEEVDVSACGIHVRSLVPRVIAATCPNLQYCRTSMLDGFLSNSYNNIEALHPCNSLTKLCICEDRADVAVSNIPMPFHSTAELVAAFPALSALHFTNVIIPFVMQAFSQQVTSLTAEISCEAEASLLQNYSNLQRLILLGCFTINNQLPLPAITEHLVVLECFGTVTDSIFEQLLQLPSLTDLVVTGFSFLTHDYSDRAFRNQVDLEMVGVIQDLLAFTKLPVRSFKQWRLSSRSLELQLPNPSNQGYLASFQKWARSIAGTSLQISLRSSVGLEFVGPVNDEDAALLFTVIASALRPCQQCDLSDFIDRPALLGAVLRWAAPELEHVHIPMSAEASKPELWHLLKEMQYVDTITLAITSEVVRTCEEYLAQMCDVICCATQHFIEPVLKLEECITIFVSLGTFRYYANGNHVDAILDMLEESLPDAVRVQWVRVSETDWKFMLQKWDISLQEPDVGTA